MMKVILFLVAVALAYATSPRTDNIDLSAPAISKDLVDYINSIPGNTWKASTDQGSFISGANLGQVKSYLGVKPGGPKLPRKSFLKLNDLPTSFDPRDKWKNCPTLFNIRDQSTCGSCWALGAAEAISDRYCTMGVNTNLSVSAADIGFCCGGRCGDGCDGGFPSGAWQYWVDNGVVSEECYPYPFPSCDHHVPNSKNPCPSNEYPTPSCPNKCSNGKTWDNSKNYGDKVYSIDGEDDLMQELYTNGPIEVAFSVYQDFLTYKSGVYQRKSNQFLGGHAVKMMGWGVENGVKYWLIANSWNPNWGDKGYFKIKKGTDECGIEDEGVAGNPKKKK